MTSEAARPKVTTRRWGAPLLALSTLLACGAASTACAAILGFEAGTAIGDEAGTDPANEGGRDATLDSPLDPGSEGGNDAALGGDGAHDAALESGVDDAALESGIDGGTEAGADAGTLQAFETALAFNGRLDAPGVAGAGGLAAADARCMDAALATFPGRTFVAWLATTGTSAPARLGGSGPWYVGATYLGVLADLTSGHLKTTLHQDPTGVTAPLPLGVWTGTNGDGTLDFTSCGDWTSPASGLSGEIGTGGGASTAWTFAAARSCDTSYHLYCFEK